MNKTEEQSGMTMEQMEEAGKIEEKKRDAEAAVAQSEAASKKRREGKEANPGCFVTGKQVHGKNVPGKTVIVLRPAGCRSVADVMRWFATSGLTAPDQIKLKDRDLDSGW
ncbi:hypothetical protein PAPYR_9941 [Paratrimastix pyriformis]|uniref:UBX domain-containing protein n=1 Tax=Paratrimastix pyriformis TaxID=342808 RepID=A0ABQ8UAU4_9EUKA|nr:hypothetical protein PAPYR_9941 [Paratrimastix pyriformis]